jgi:hypothetical protein
MWVFTYKFDEDGYYTKAKARLVVRGDLQPRSEEENHATTALARVLRMITVLMAMYDLDLKQQDAVNAFLNAILYKPVYTRMPPGHGIPGKIWKLLRALYGLQKSPWLWQEDLSTIIKAHGLQPVPDEECLFTNEFMLVLIYVDDILIVNLPTYAGCAAAA